MEKAITAVMIDTSAYHNRQCDFSGMTTAMIPTFLRLMESNHIPVLSHPILDAEVRKHIDESEIIKKAQNLTDAIKKSKGVLASLGLSSAELMEIITAEKIKSTLLEAYENFSKSFVMLPYVKAQDVFADYFSKKPPFSTTGSKKAEFPDAFVLKGLLQYCVKNPNDQILVVSSDTDWERTLLNHEQIIMVATLQEALAFMWPQLDDKVEFVSRIWAESIPQIMTAVSTAAEREAYSIDDIYELEDIDISNVRAVSMVGNMTPLEITDTSVLIHATVSLSVTGTAEYCDESRSVWDREDQMYYYKAYTRIHFEDASAEAECEVCLDFPADGSMKNIVVRDVRMTNKWDISIDTTDAITSEEDITGGEDDDGYWLME
ncbi:MAG: hypothetical protein E7438_04405 [Ruminococcaceae bacterium]|nr:hypothetical protein [Oscillospiraceae bacterium]